MTTKIEVRNFQSIEHAVLTVDGFTALAGRSNIGKSAIIRAVEAALGGSSGANFVRHGAHCARRLKDVGKCKCIASVRITAEGFDLLWEKGDGVNRYVYNNVTYDSVARGFPEFLRAEFNPVKIGDKYTQLQIASQWEPIFLLNASGGVVADVLSDVAHLQRINVALALSEKDRREATAGHKSRLKDAVAKETELQGYDGLDAALARVRAVETHMLDVNAKTAKLRALEAYLDSLRALVARVRSLLVVEAVVVPGSELVMVAGVQVRALLGFNANLRFRASNVKALLPIENVLEPDIQGVQQAKVKFGQVVFWTKRMQDLESNLKFWAGIDGLNMPVKPSFNGPLAKLSALAGYAKKQQALKEQVSRLEQACAQAGQEETISFEAIRALGACPTCTRPFEVGCQC